VAQQEVETSMYEFIKLHEEYEFNLGNERATREAVRVILEQFKEGDVDFGRVFVVQSNLVQAQDTLVANRASIALALINTYVSLGGGWEIRCEPSSNSQMLQPSAVTAAETAPFMSSNNVPEDDLTPFRIRHVSPAKLAAQSRTTARRSSQKRAGQSLLESR